MGLDVHAAKVVAAIADSNSGELAVRRMGGATDQVADFCSELPAPVRVAYEAGPTGFGLARALAERGVACTVAAPGKIERPAQDRVKTDRRDAERLVRLLMIGGLHPVRVPSPAEEAMRDLVRAREDVRGDLMRARHRVAKLLLRHDLRFEGNNWTQRHLDWLGRVELPEPVAQTVLADGIGAIDALLVRRESLEAQMASLVAGSPWEQTVDRLRCLRGIDTLSALGLCAEVGDFERFGRPAQLMSYLGLVPSESSSGERRRQGRSPSRAPATPAVCWSRPPGTTAALRAKGASCAAARRGNPRRSARSRGGPSSGSIAAGCGWIPSAASAAPSAPSPWRGSWRASAGRCRPPPEATKHCLAEEAAELGPSRSASAIQL